MLLGVVEGDRCDQTPVLLVIAVTILCLTRLYNHIDQFFSGSPLLQRLVFKVP